MVGNEQMMVGVIFAIAGRCLRLPEVCLRARLVGYLFPMSKIL